MKNSISLEKAIDMTTLFRDEKNTIINPEYIGREVLPRAETFDREIVDSILSKPGCVKFRIYSGMNDQLQLRSIMVGVDSNDADILPPAKLSPDDEEQGFIGEEGNVCPPLCGASSPLNP